MLTSLSVGMVRESSFEHSEGPMNLMQACLNAWNYRKSSFHCRGSSVKRVLTRLCARMVRESSFDCSGGTVELVQAS